MKPSTRLDVVVRVKERDESRALKALADAQNVARTAEQETRAAREQAHRDGRGRSTVDFWELAESAHTRALVQLRQAEERFRQAGAEVEKARAAHIRARAKTQAVRQVADARRAEQLVELERAERKQMDEVAGIMHWRKTSS